MNKDIVLFAKLYDDARIPTKRDEDGCFDIYPHFESEHMYFEPNETRMVPTGLISAFDSSYQVFLKERGSTGTKGIGQRAGVIDSGYRGEWLVPVTNHNSKPLIITKETSESALGALTNNYVVYPYSKAICQAAVIPVPAVHIEEVSPNTVRSIPSDRGEGKLGSSGK